MGIKTIDINCDVGEGVANEKQLFPFISSCNIACGGHAGDENTIRETVLLAKKYRVNIGGHPSFPDKENFGRKKISISNDLLIQSIHEQLKLFSTIIGQESIKIHHIKPHGALYNGIAESEELANVFLDAIEAYKNTPIYLPYLSKIHKVAIKRGFKFYLEAFADRNYDSNLNLISRVYDNAIIHKPKRVLEHVLNMIEREEVKTVEGVYRRINAHTFCVHGDTPSALEILVYLHEELPKYGIQIK